MNVSLDTTTLFPGARPDLARQVRRYATEGQHATVSMTPRPDLTVCLSATEGSDGFSIGVTRPDGTMTVMQYDHSRGFYAPRG